MLWKAYIVLPSVTALTICNHYLFFKPLKYGHIFARKKKNLHGSRSKAVKNVVTQSDTGD
jgi:hypothetical protein